MKPRRTLPATLLLALLMTTSHLAYGFSAVSPSGHTLFYDVIDSGRVEVALFLTGYCSGDLVVPDSVVDGDSVYAVTAIADDAFKYCNGLTSVELPDGLVSIGGHAFVKCSSLGSVVIPYGVTTLDT